MLKFVSLNSFAFSSYVTLSKNKPNQKIVSNHELFLLILIPDSAKGKHKHIAYIIAFNCLNSIVGFMSGCIIGNFTSSLYPGFVVVL